MAVVSFAASDVITGLVTTLRAATGFRAPTTAGTDVPVFDGPIYGGGSNFSAVVIGADGLEDATQRPVRFTSEWHDMDLTTDEVGTIQCAVLVWSGDANADTIATQRAAALAILQDVDTAVRASNTAAALGVTQLLWSKIDSGEMFQTTADGTETRLTFTYSYRALLQVT
jgi:hypothetical protein